MTLSSEAAGFQLLGPSRGRIPYAIKVNRAVFTELYYTENSVGPWKIAESLTLPEKVYAGRRKTDVLTHVKAVLGRMVTHGLAEEAGMVPGKKSEYTMTYRLTPEGRMVKAVLLPPASGDKDWKAREAEDVRRFILSRIKGSGFSNVNFKCLLAMLHSGYLEAAYRLMRTLAETLCSPSFGDLIDMKKSQRIYEDWQDSLSDEEARALNRAYKSVHRELTADERRRLDRILSAQERADRLSEEVFCAEFKERSGSQGNEGHT